MQKVPVEQTKKENQPEREVDGYANESKQKGENMLCEQVRHMQETNCYKLLSSKTKVIQTKVTKNV